LQSKQEQLDNNLSSELKKMDSVMLLSCFNDPKEIKSLSDDLFRKFDEDGNQDFSIEEFMDLCK